MSESLRMPARRSVFLVSVAVIVACIFSVASTMAYLVNASTREQAREVVRSDALVVTDLIARNAGGALQFNRPDALQSLLDRTLHDSDENAVGGLGLSLAHGPVATSGEVSAELTALARRAAEQEETTLSVDAFSVAVPVFYGSDNAVVGAVAMEWTPDIRLASAQRDILMSLAFAGVVTVLATLGATLFLRRYLSQPLRELAGAMDRMSTGDYASETPTMDRPDEIGEMARVLDRFREALASGEETRRGSLFKSAALESTSAPILMLDEGLRIVQLNSALVALFDRLETSIRAADPSFDAAALPGKPVASLHAIDGDLERRLSDPEALPATILAKVGQCRLSLQLAAVRDSDGEVIGRVVEVSDVTEATLNRSIISSIDSFQVYAEFSETGDLVKANEQFRRAFGLTHGAEAKGRRLADLLEVDGLDRGVSVIDAISGGRPATGMLRSRSGTGIVQGTVFAVMDANGTVMRHIVIGQDMTAVEAEREAQRKRRKEAEAAQALVVESLTHALRSVSNGDLTTRIDSSFAEDYEQVRKDFNTTVSTLCDVVGTVSEMAGNVRREAAEIAGSADSLSGRTERTAATLEETAAALDELTSSVRSAAEGAVQAKDVVDNTKASAEQSGLVVEQAVQAMSSIEESSQKIAKIIDVIEDIAFQTNLLALNAGVEAARAGEAGRGFAVVASEVRALAQRSSDAAREINDLISSSGTHVQRGVELVGEAGEALKKILSSIGEISKLVSGIAVSSREQSTGVSEINTAVNQLDQATQQNAAMFEETTAASHSLTQLAESLNSTVERFEIGTRPAQSEVAFASPVVEEKDRSSAVPASPAVSSKVAATGATALAEEMDHDTGWEEF